MAYEGELLLQGVHDAAVIVLLQRTLEAATIDTCASRDSALMLLPSSTLAHTNSDIFISAFFSDTYQQVRSVSISRQRGKGFNRPSLQSQWSSPLGHDSAWAVNSLKTHGYMLSWTLLPDESARESCVLPPTCVLAAGANAKCALCGKIVYPMEFVGVSDKAFHKTCFKCSVCKVDSGCAVAGREERSEGVRPSCLGSMCVWPMVGQDRARPWVDRPLTVHA